MNLALFFEGTGQGVAGKFTNVTRLKEMCVEDETQRLHLEAGPGTRFGAYLFGKICGADCRAILRSARRWFQQNYTTLPAPCSPTPPPTPPPTPTPCSNSTSHSHSNSFSTSVYLFGFSRGALLARKFAEWLDKLGIEVAYLGVWDTVDSAMKVDVGEECPKCVGFARHAVARDERRKYFGLVPLRFRAKQGEERVFPGVHSDVGGLYEDNHDMADAALTWIGEEAVARGLKLKAGRNFRRGLELVKLPVHDSFRLISNLWGLLGENAACACRRRLSGGMEK